MANLFLPLILLQWDETLLWAAWLTGNLMWWFPRWSFLRLSTSIASSIRFTYFLEPDRRARLLRAKMFRAWLAPLVVLSATWILWYQREQLSVTVLGILGAHLFFLYIMARMIPMKMFLTAGPEGWARLGGIHDDAIRLLDAWKAANPGNR